MAPDPTPSATLQNTVARARFHDWNDTEPRGPESVNTRQSYDGQRDKSDLVHAVLIWCVFNASVCPISSLAHLYLLSHS